MASPIDVILGALQGEVGVILNTVSTVLSIDQQILLAQTQGETIALLQGISARLDNINTLLTGMGTLLSSMNAILIGLQTSQAQGDNTSVILQQQLLAQLQISIQGVSQQITNIGGGGGTASEIWNYVQPGADRSQGDYQVLAGLVSLNLNEAHVAFPTKDSPIILVNAYWGEPIADIRGDSPPDISTDTIGSYPHVLDWLEGESGWSGWAFNDAGYPFVKATLAPEDSSRFVCTLSESDFQRLKGGGVTLTVPLPPVWPGLSGVTLGSVHALVDQMELTGAMSGVLIELTAWPPTVPIYPYGSRTSVVKIGALVFSDDNGEAEFIDAIMLDRQVIACKAMTQASKVSVRVRPGISGTIRTWLVTP